MERERERRREIRGWDIYASFDVRLRDNDVGFDDDV